VLAVLSGWLIPWLFVPLGVLGLYASKFGDDPFIEWLPVIPKLHLRLQCGFFSAADSGSAG